MEVCKPLGGADPLTRSSGNRRSVEFTHYNRKHNFFTAKSKGEKKKKVVKIQMNKTCGVIQHSRREHGLLWAHLSIRGNAALDTRSQRATGDQLDGNSGQSRGKPRRETEALLNWCQTVEISWTWFIFWGCRVYFMSTASKSDSSRPKQNQVEGKMLNCQLAAASVQDWGSLWIHWTHTKQPIQNQSCE